MPAKPVNVLDFEAIAREQMTPSAYDYYAGGAEDEITLGENRLALSAHRLAPARAGRHRDGGDRR